RFPAAAAAESSIVRRHGFQSECSRRGTGRRLRLHSRIGRPSDQGHLRLRVSGRRQERRRRRLASIGHGSIRAAVAERLEYEIKWKWTPQKANPTTTSTRWSGRWNRGNGMRVGLFVPCYVDAFFPDVGIATLQLLERLGIEVVYPLDQTCCGQPMANCGCQKDAAGAEALFVTNFQEFETIVTSSGSCAHHVREHLDAIPQTPPVEKVRRSTYELVEFLHDIVKVDEFPWAEFPHKVGLHNTCTTLRKLRTAKASEIDEPFFSKPLDLLRKVRGIEFVMPSRPDECCGFGGTFSVFEEPVSAKMGYDKVEDHHRAGAEYIVSADMSCLMHQKGCAERLGLDI